MVATMTTAGTSGGVELGAGMGQTSLNDTLRAVEAEIAAGSPDRALALVQDVQARYPRALAVQRVLGEVYLALRKPREALGALDRALAGNPEDARACCARAIVNQIQGDTMAALAWYRRACDILPDDQMLRSTYREMATHLNQPPYRPSRTGLARLYMRGDLYVHAIREWETLLAEQPDSVEVQVGLAETLWRAGRVHEAAERCRRTLNNVPSCVKVLLILAAIELDAGNTEEAQRLVRRGAELDPDQRVAQALYADRFASGDRALYALLTGEAPGSARDGRVASAPLAAGVPGQPLEQAVRTPGPVSAPLNGPQYSTGGPSLETYTATARPSALPPDFHTIFAETEYMLWSRDEEAARAAGTDTSAFDRSRVADPFARSTLFVPPVLREQGGALEDTEARAAINWINWLQAQGARQRDALPGAKPMSGPLTGSFASSGGRPQAPQRDTQMPPASANGQTGPLPPRRTGPLLPPMPTGPLPPPSSEALRAMFAELEPEASTRRVVEGAIVDSGLLPTESLNRSHASSGPQPQGTGELPAWAVSQGAAAGWAVDDNPPEAIGAFHSGASHDGHAEGDGDVTTLESLERDFAESGFKSVELRPGELAAFASDGDGSTSADRLEVPSAQMAEPDPIEPSTSFEPALPASDDYHGRLELARHHRSSGRMDDALTEYRVILKNAPDLLSEIVDDLQASVADVPDHPEVHQLIGDARIRQGDYLSALESYNRAVALTQSQGS